MRCGNGSCEGDLGAEAGIAGIASLMGDGSEHACSAASASSSISRERLRLLRSWLLHSSLAASPGKGAANLQGVIILGD